MELKKTLLDRMVHLLSRGYVLPVVGYIRKCLEKLNTDISLIRYFVTEVRHTLSQKLSLRSHFKENGLSVQHSCAGGNGSGIENIHFYFCPVRCWM